MKGNIASRPSSASPHIADAPPRARRRGWKPYGQVVELDVTEAGPGGDGLAAHEASRYRVWGALPGERVQARIVGRQRGWRLAETEAVLRPSPHRVVPRCRVFGQCGGCTWQNLSYDAQTEVLQDRVRQLLDPWVTAACWRPLVAADDPWHYRGKIEMTFGGEAGRIALGFLRRRRFWDVVDVEECFIGPPINRDVIAHVRQWADECGHAPFHARRRDGWLRWLVIRQAFNTPLREWLAALVTAHVASGATVPDPAWRLDALAQRLSSVEPRGTLLWIGTDPQSGAVRPLVTQVLLGGGTLSERLGGVAYRVGVDSFFQANARMAERLLSVVRERVRDGVHDKVVDLFCGVGTLALGLADDCQRVVGVEFVEAAVRDAEANALARGLTHVRFVHAAAEKYEWDGDVDLILLDPPRSGLHPRLPRMLAERGPQRLVYVSCNAEALANDLAVLSSHYAVRFAQCVDMFAHTPHVETVLELTRIPTTDEGNTVESTDLDRDAPSPMQQEGAP